jgi:hypothetical protein
MDVRPSRSNYSRHLRMLRGRVLGDGKKGSGIMDMRLSRGIRTRHLKLTRGRILVESHQASGTIDVRPSRSICTRHVACIAWYSFPDFEEIVLPAEEEILPEFAACFR